jgi:L-2-hydroxyglutarate oxidase LhgO
LRLKKDLELETVECIVAGAGVVGLAIARALALRGREVLVLEKNSDFGLETSSRNSEVIHAGIYYRPGSRKARLCRRGRDLLAAYLGERGIPHRFCGKLIIATEESQVAALTRLHDNALANGVQTLRRVDHDEIRTLEPDIASHGGLLSPETGIVDARAFMRAMVADLEDAGGTIAYSIEALSVTPQEDGLRVATRDSLSRAHDIRAKIFVNAAGLHASALAQNISTPERWQPPATHYARGSYFRVDGTHRFRHLVYPTPVPGGLGIHLTLDLQGAVRFGPDVEWIEDIDYTIRDGRASAFREAIARYWPGVADRKLSADYCGIRPKVARQGEGDGDFVVAGPSDHGVPGLVQLFGMESPGLTASMAIGDHVADLLDGT